MLYSYVWVFTYTLTYTTWAYCRLPKVLIIQMLSKCNLRKSESYQHLYFLSTVFNPNSGKKTAVFQKKFSLNYALVNENTLFLNYGYKQIYRIKFQNKLIPYYDKGN